MKNLSHLAWLMDLIATEVTVNELDPVFGYKVILLHGPDSSQLFPAALALVYSLGISDYFVEHEHVEGCCGVDSQLRFLNEAFNFLKKEKKRAVILNQVDGALLRAESMTKHLSATASEFIIEIDSGQNKDYQGYIILTSHSPWLIDEKITHKGRVNSMVLLGSSISDPDDDGLEKKNLKFLGIKQHLFRRLKSHSSMLGYLVMLVLHHWTKEFPELSRQMEYFFSFRPKKSPVEFNDDMKEKIKRVSPVPNPILEPVQSSQYFMSLLENCHHPDERWMILYLKATIPHVGDEAPLKLLEELEEEFLSKVELNLDPESPSGRRFSAFIVDWLKNYKISQPEKVLRKVLGRGHYQWLQNYWLQGLQFYFSKEALDEAFTRPNEQASRIIIWYCARLSMLDDFSDLKMRIYNNALGPEPESEDAQLASYIVLFHYLRYPTSLLCHLFLCYFGFEGSKHFLSVQYDALVSSREAGDYSVCRVREMKEVFFSTEEKYIRIQKNLQMPFKKFSNTHVRKIHNWLLEVGVQ